MTFKRLKPRPFVKISKGFKASFIDPLNKIKRLLRILGALFLEFGLSAHPERNLP